MSEEVPHIMDKSVPHAHADDCPGCIDWARRMNEYHASQQSTPPPPSQHREPIEADREAAAELAEWLIAAERAWSSDRVPFFVNDFPASIREGFWDSHALVQAFMRHRLAFSTPAASDAAITTLPAAASVVADPYSLGSAKMRWASPEPTHQGTIRTQAAASVEVGEDDKVRAVDLAHDLGISCEDFTSKAADILLQHLRKHRQAVMQDAVKIVLNWTPEAGPRVPHDQSESPCYWQRKCIAAALTAKGKDQAGG